MKTNDRTTKVEVIRHRTAEGELTKSTAVWLSFKEAEIISSFLAVLLRSDLYRDIEPYAKLLGLGVGFKWTELAALQEKLTDFLNKNVES